MTRSSTRHVERPVYLWLTSWSVRIEEEAAPLQAQMLIAAAAVTSSAGLSWAVTQCTRGAHAALFGEVRAPTQRGTDASAAPAPQPPSEAAASMHARDRGPQQGTAQRGEASTDAPGKAALDSVPGSKLRTSEATSGGAPHPSGRLQRGDKQVQEGAAACIAVLVALLRQVQRSPLLPG